MEQFRTIKQVVLAEVRTGPLPHRHVEATVHVCSVDAVEAISIEVQKSQRPRFSIKRLRLKLPPTPKSWEVAPYPAEPSIQAFRFIPHDTVHLYQLPIAVTKDSHFRRKLKKQAGRTGKGLYVPFVIGGPKGRKPRELLSLAARPAQEGLSAT